MHTALTRAYIALGSNLHQPRAQVRSALVQLQALPRSQWVGVSSLYRTPPMGPQNQPDYINAVAALDTQIAALELLDYLLRIERMHGRVRDASRWGARTLDLDLILYGDHSVQLPRLTIPHSGLHERDFVLVPLCELAPDVVIPARGRAADLLAALPASTIERVSGD